MRASNLGIGTPISPLLQVTSGSCIMWQSEQRISGSCQCIASKGGRESGTKGFMPWLSLSLTQLRWFLHILLSSQTKYFCRGNVYAQEERAFQSLWNLSWSTPTQIAEMAQLAHYRVSTASRSFSFGFALSLQCRLVNGDIYWERVTFKILKITFKASHQTIAQV